MYSKKFKKYKELSCGDDPENLLIQGENYNTLTVLREQYTGRVDCVYIDPPYNNKDNFRHYQDDSCHVEWLVDISSRVALLKEFLKDDGSLWVSIDDNEMHYLKVELDKIFGRENFVSTIVWEHRTTRDNRVTFSNNHEYILVYSPNPKKFRQRRNLLEATDEVLARYKNPDDDPRGPWQSVSANVQDGHAAKSQFYEVVSPSGKVHRPPHGRCWAYNEDRMLREIKSNNIWFGKSGDGVPRIKKFLSEAKIGMTPNTFWPAGLAGTTKQSKKHILNLFGDDLLFDTPKPESLIKKILSISTNPGDLVLDAYLGSGTTAAVAHKMDRKYIGIEFGDHAVSLCAKRLKMVVNGESGGISSEVGWNGGGGFTFLKAN